MHVLSIAPTAPVAGQPYAGAWYYESHLRALATFAVVDVLSPENTAAATSALAVPSITWFRIDTPTRGLAKRCFDRVYNFIKVITPGLGVERSVERALAALTRRPDLVEIQWPEYQGLIPVIRRSLGDVPVISVVHDVYFERLRRSRSTDRLTLSGVRARLLPDSRVRAREAMLLNKTDLVLVFTQSDLTSLNEAGVSTRVEVVDPPLHEAQVCYPATYESTSANPTALFVGAFDRTPNLDAAYWLLQDIWPHVAAAVPDAQLVIAGHCSATALDDAVRDRPDVRVTGFVPDLSELYLSSDIVVAPLRLGAGLKFKVATAMLWRRPVVATEVAAEGYSQDPGVLGHITSSPSDFAQEMIVLLTDKNLASRRADRAFESVSERFGRDRFTRRLTSLYSGFARANRDR